MAVVKIIELVGSSKTSTDDAAKQALSQAQGTLRNIRAVDIVSTGIRGENLDEYRAHVRVAFLTGTANDPLEVAGRLVARLGDALALRTGAPGARAFDGDALAAFGHDPASALAAHAADLAGAGLTLLQEAVGPLLGAGATRTVGVAAGALVVTVGTVEVRWLPGTTRVEVTVTADGVPGVGSARAAVTLDATGLLALDVAVGPADLAAGPVRLRPYGRALAGTTIAGGPVIETGLGVGVDDLLTARWHPASGTFALLAITDAERDVPGRVGGARRRRGRGARRRGRPRGRGRPRPRSRGAGPRPAGARHDRAGAAHRRRARGRRRAAGARRPTWTRTRCPSGWRHCSATSPTRRAPPSRSTMR